ncbi:MAG TPA: hypothetical protein DCM87_21220 [Planctomycetes bacterium]|jgi:hypothetical protein|nr:hypothetical protein [Planctomycetota bacterium]
MAVDYRLDAYLALERLMLDLDERGDPAADAIRDLMDPIWYALSPEARAILDGREIREIHRLNPVTLSAEGVFIPEPKRDRGEGFEIHTGEIGMHYRGEAWAA